ncbi:MAG: cytochrome-c peroxidase [Candidatus Latescibacteria bacterium]|nr:cytochrome-c peroxidase [Candidatus Latescibacterota bacterium]
MGQFAKKPLAGRPPLWWAIAGTVLALVVGCADKDPLSAPADAPKQANKLIVSAHRAGGYKPEHSTSRQLIRRFDLNPLGPIPYPPDNPPVQERIELGRLLFFDPLLGGEKDVACGTCHHPDFAFADFRQFGAGTSGEGLADQRVIGVSAISGLPIADEPRNSPTIFNTAFNADENGQPSHQGLQFLDGRVNGLEAQATKPITSRVEMRGDAYPGTDAEAVAATLDSVVARLQQIPAYVELFRAAFPQEADQRAGAAVIDSSTYGRALAAYERELVTRNSPYDRFIEGDDQALTPFQKRGLVLFFTKAKCAVCHNGPMFSDFRFIVQGVPQEGPGKDVIAGDDTGREEFTLDPADRYAFRTLTLRNIELTAPYMHDGVFATLEEVVHFYNNGARPRHPAVGDEMLDPILTQPLGLSQIEVEAVVEFMRTLTDPGTALDPLLITVPEEVPSGLPPVFGVRAL